MPVKIKLNELKHPCLYRNACLVDGQWIEAESGASVKVFNPASGQLIGTVPALAPVDIQKAISAAHHAWAAWRSRTASERTKLLHAWAELILMHQNDLAKLLTAEQGKPFVEAEGEISYAVSFVEWFAEEAKRVEGDILTSPRADQRLLVMKQPVGVCAAITPWNFPAAMITRKVAPALAAGCPIIIKPAQQTPFTALALGALAQEAGIPAGVLQVVTGEAEEIGALLCQSPVVRKLSFTGSTKVGRLLMRQCADTIKKISLELGGNAPLIVFEDANIEQAVQAIMTAKFRNTGQTCISTNRIYVHHSIYEALSQQLVQAVKLLQVGPGEDPLSTLGPLIDQAALDKVKAHLNDACALGARILVGGQSHHLGGTFFEPTILTEATARMRLAQEETFGPIAPLFRFDSEDEVIKQANHTEFGLASYVFTQNQQRIWRVIDALETGMIGINTSTISNEVAPFGGIKQSGIGREGSRYGIEDYLEMKYICLQTQ